jgi:hypothetical protein
MSSPSSDRFRGLGTETFCPHPHASACAAPSPSSTPGRARWSGTPTSTCSCPPGASPPTGAPGARSRGGSGDLSHPSAPSASSPAVGFSRSLDEPSRACHCLPFRRTARRRDAAAIPAARPAQGHAPCPRLRAPPSCPTPNPAATPAALGATSTGRPRARQRPAPPRAPDQVRPLRSTRAHARASLRARLGDEPAAPHDPGVPGPCSASGATRARRSLSRRSKRPANARPRRAGGAPRPRTHDSPHYRHSPPLNHALRASPRPPPLPARLHERSRPPNERPPRASFSNLPEPTSLGLVQQAL